MQEILLQQVTIVAPGSPFDGQVRDVLVRNGRIAKVAPSITDQAERIIKKQGAFLSIGWVDTGVQTGEPGYEHRETLATVGAAAAAGGFTGIVCEPNTLPVVQSSPDLLYIQHKTSQQLVSFYPTGALTKDCAGEEITEMLEMNAAGAVAFTDGSHPVLHPGILLRALQYVKTFSGLVVNRPLEPTIGKNGLLHEGIVSTSLGMKGIPAIAEDLMVQRDLKLLEYADSRLHLSCLSSAGAVQLVREAKAKGLRVTASVSVMNLAYDHTALSDFDSQMKLMPPLRTSADREALQQGVIDGTIDIITSNHVPVEQEGKKLEFPYAAFGAIGLETLYALCATHLSDWLSPALMVEKIAIAPRRIFGLPLPTITEDAPVDCTVFVPNAEWTYQAEQVKSRSRNSPLIGQSLRGRVLATIKNDYIYQTK